MSLNIKPGKLLGKINSPDDLKKLSIEQLPQVCAELRQYIIDVVSVYGGHFGASLGVVEMTVAMHYVFNTPYDRLVWDVGHQAYGHKILTGRRDSFYTNRKYKGVAGFPKREESEYDTFGVGHSSTSISAALGMAQASLMKGETERQHIAIIGDGAMTAGLAFEGLNNAGASDTNIIVVLNDNCMSIDPNVGALKDYLTDITTSSAYNKFRDECWKALGRIGKIGENAQGIASKIEHSIKSLFLAHSNLFESLNFRYFGPTDGHDVIRLVGIMEDLKHLPGPKLLHCRTIKGKGFKQADQVAFPGIV
jgi:1-deoxy-D-xylulose-5-phosphate synthase